MQKAHYSSWPLKNSVKQLSSGMLDLLVIRSILVDRLGWAGGRISSVVTIQFFELGEFSAVIRFQILELRPLACAGQCSASVDCKIMAVSLGETCPIWLLHISGLLRAYIVVKKLVASRIVFSPITPQEIKIKYRAIHIN